MGQAGQHRWSGIAALASGRPAHQGQAHALAQRCDVHALAERCESHPLAQRCDAHQMKAPSSLTL